MLHERNTDEEDFMQEAESAVSSTLEPCSIRYCIALMKELKMELQKTAFAQISDCVLALSVPEIITQKNVRTAMEKAGFHVIRVMTATDACALSKAQGMKHDQQFDGSSRVQSFRNDQKGVAFAGQFQQDVQ